VEYCVHFVGFRDERYWNAVRVYGKPDVIHRVWDKRALREIGPTDTVVFADGDYTQDYSKYNSDDIDERYL
jgi:hypothetical protein